MSLLAGANREPVLVWKMMERLGIEAVGGVLPRWSMCYVTALHRCETCSSKDACRDWLGSVSGPATFAPRFCPSTDLLFELRLEQPAPRPC